MGSNHGQRGGHHIDWLSVVGAVSQDVAGKHEGTTASLDLLGKYSPVSQWTLTAGPGVTWGSPQYNQTFFGVNAEDSAWSGLLTYSLGSGIAAVRLTAGAGYALNKHNPFSNVANHDHFNIT